jgi:hypothetical protein
MGADLCEVVVDDEALARPSQAFKLLREGEISPEVYPLWIVDECHRTRRSEYRHRLAHRRTRGPSGPLQDLLAEMKELMQACRVEAHQRYYDPAFGFGVSPAIAMVRSFG